MSTIHDYTYIMWLTYKQHGSVLSPVATDALVLKHQAISSHNADQISTALDQF